MEPETKNVNPSILTNILTAILIFALAPMLLGKVEAIGLIAVIPWLMTAFPILLIAVIYMFKMGDSLGATVNAVMTGILMCQMMIKGLILLLFSVTKTPVPEALTRGFDIMSGGAFLTAAIFLACMAFINFKAKQTVQASLVCLPTAGFALIGLASYGLGPILGLVGSVLLIAFGFWLLYSGIAMSLHTAFRVKVLPY